MFSEFVKVNIFGVLYGKDWILQQVVKYDLFWDDFILEFVSSMLLGVGVVELLYCIISCEMWWD